VLVVELQCDSVEWVDVLISGRYLWNARKQFPSLRLITEMALLL
jgi:hypothetical protein